MKFEEKIKKYHELVATAAAAKRELEGLEQFVNPTKETLKKDRRTQQMLEHKNSMIHFGMWRMTVKRSDLVALVKKRIKELELEVSNVEKEISNF